MIELEIHAPLIEPKRIAPGLAYLRTSPLALLLLGLGIGNPLAGALGACLRGMREGTLTSRDNLFFFGFVAIIVPFSTFLLLRGMRFRNRAEAGYVVDQVGIGEAIDGPGFRAAVRDKWIPWFEIVALKSTSQGLCIYKKGGKVQTMPSLLTEAAFAAAPPDVVRRVE